MKAKKNITVPDSNIAVAMLNFAVDVEHFGLRIAVNIKKGAKVNVQMKEMSNVLLFRKLWCSYLQSCANFTGEM